MLSFKRFRPTKGGSEICPPSLKPTPEQLAVMTEVLDSHCLTHNVVDAIDRAQHRNSHHDAL